MKPKPKIKPILAYAIVTPPDFPQSAAICLRSISRSRQEAIDSLLAFEAATHWGPFYKKGFRAMRVRVEPESSGKTKT